MDVPSYLKIGTSEVRRETKGVIIPETVRDRHIYVVGKTRTGKSTLVFNMALQDITAGRGVAVIDPHGDLVEDLLQHIPASRVNNTIYFDAAERERPLGLNIFSSAGGEETGLLVDDLLVMFKRISETWGERMESLLRYAFYTLLAAPGTTFLDVHRLFQDEVFRQRIIRHVQQPLLREFWELQYPNLPKDAAQPILNRMTKFLLSPTLTGLLGQGQSKLNFFEIIQSRKIFLANLSQGKIGADSAQLVGSLLVSQLQLAIMRRANLARAERHPYYLYVDEFQNVLTSAFEKILSEAGKYKLCLTLCHQFLSQLDEKTRSAIFGNVGTIIIFNLGFQDARFLQPELGRFRVEDVVNLDRDSHEAFCKPATKASDTFKFKTLPPPPIPQPNFVAEILQQTKDRYSTVGASLVAEPRAPLPVLLSPSPPATDPLVSVMEAVTEEMAAPLVPSLAVPQLFASLKEKILHYVTQAEYLSTQQIIELCFQDYTTEASKKANASAMLSELIQQKQLRKQPFGRGNIYFVGRMPNPNPHNVAVRDLYVKVMQSQFELQELKFFYPDVPNLLPDLYVSFLSADDQPLRTFFEMDMGTEGVGELKRKLERYAKVEWARLVFVALTPERRTKLARTLAGERVRFAVLGEFSRLSDAAFVASAEGEARPLFAAGTHRTEEAESGDG